MKQDSYFVTRSIEHRYFDYVFGLLLYNEGAQFILCHYREGQLLRLCFKNDKVMLFGHICTFSHNQFTVRRLQQGGISGSGYFFYQILRCKGRPQSTKVTEQSKFLNSSVNHVLSQGVWIDMASATAAALCETFWTASKNLTLL